MNPFAAGPLTLALGSMGAGGGTSPNYQESASFQFNATGGTFLLDLFDNTSLGSGFDSASFEIVFNGNTLDSESFMTLAAAQAFFSNHLIGIPLAEGDNTILIAFDETMSGGEGFSFDYGVLATVSATPLPTSLPLLATGLGGLGLLGWRRKRKAQAVA